MPLASDFFYDGRLIYQEDCKIFLGTIYLQSRKIVGDSVRIRY